MLTRIYHKKNELFQVEFYQNEECQQVFNFENIKNLYIELKDGDCTPIFSLSNKLWSLNIKANIFTPAWYLGLYDGISPQTPLITLNDVLDDIDLSKYIPKDNAVLFLSEGEANKHSNNCEAWFLYQKDFPARQFNSEMDIRDWKAITIFLTHGTESELKKANEIVQELKEKYGVYEVNVFVLHCFVNLRPTWLPQISFLNGVLTFHFFNILTHSKQEIILAREECGEELENNYYCAGINTITTTNSTKIAHNEGYHCELEHKFNILDCYDIFNDYLEGE
ncbi:hypothetical protein UFOVP286_79 [uncultured Caudovirales phage]|uniref:Uncharacterized protein n=1 Tax=uncultured Caudovirales phage TaxID=2100421 RepID=A0A6J5LRL1_9CAUD|nr:hypothetical protein UFOVP286_79 [uncultured Caudovirales phage]